MRYLNIALKSCITIFCLNSIQLFGQVELKLKAQDCSTWSTIIAEEGKSVTIEASPQEGYRFVRWSDGNTSNPRTITITQATDLIAEFEQTPIRTLSIKSEECSIADTIKVADGRDITIEGVAQDGYRFVCWSDDNTTNPRTIHVSGDSTLFIKFLPNDQFLVNLKGINCSVQGGGTYAKNESVTLIATPNEHCHFVQWSDGSTSNPRTIIVTSDKMYTAECALDQFTITATGEHGSVTGSGTYNYGATATLTATNSDCYSFQKWSDGNTDNPRQVVVTQDSTFTAIFVGTGYQETLKCTVVNESPYGTVSFTGTVIKDSNISLQATAPECSKFVKWSDNDTSNPRNLTVTQDSTFTAIFEKVQFNITLETEDESKGEVDGE